MFFGLNPLTRTYSEILGETFRCLTLQYNQTLSASGDSHDLESPGRRNIVFARGRSNPCPPPDHTKPRLLYHESLLEVTGGTLT